PVPEGQTQCPRCGLRIDALGYPTEPVYLDFTKHIDNPSFPTPLERRAFHPEIQELACRCFGHPAFTVETLNRLTTWRSVEIPTAKDVYGIPLRDVAARLRAAAGTSARPPDQTDESRPPPAAGTPAAAVPSSKPRSSARRPQDLRVLQFMVFWENE